MQLCNASWPYRKVKKVSLKKPEKNLFVSPSKRSLDLELYCIVWLIGILLSCILENLFILGFCPFHTPEWGVGRVGNFQNPIKKSPIFIRACNVLDSENMPLYSTIQNHIFPGGRIRFIVSLKETGGIQNINRYHLPLIVFSAQRR
jgi:hypothetical protein